MAGGHEINFPAGTRFLVTAGPTYEPIDPVRFIGNFSTGKMGFAIAEALAERGAEVKLIAGPVHIDIDHALVERIDVQTADEMYEACHREFPLCAGAILSAAVADYKPAEKSAQKIKKNEGDGDYLELKLVKNRDILASLGEIKRTDQVLAGFSLETHDELRFAREKLKKKNCDLIVLNSMRDAGAGFAHDTNKIRIITADGGGQEYPLKSKKEVATDIADFMLVKYFGRNIVK